MLLSFLFKIFYFQFIFDFIYCIWTSRGVLFYVDFLILSLFYNPTLLLNCLHQIFLFKHHLILWKGLSNSFVINLCFYAGLASQVPLLTLLLRSHCSLYLISFIMLYFPSGEIVDDEEEKEDDFDNIDQIQVNMILMIFSLMHFELEHYFQRDMFQ